MIFANHGIHRNHGINMELGNLKQTRSFTKLHAREYKPKGAINLYLLSLSKSRRENFQLSSGKERRSHKE